MQRRLYIDEAHTALDIFRFAVFLSEVSSIAYKCCEGPRGKDIDEQGECEVNILSDLSILMENALEGWLFDQVMKVLEKVIMIRKVNVKS